MKYMYSWNYPSMSQDPHVSETSRGKFSIAPIHSGKFPIIPFFNGGQLVRIRSQLKYHTPQVMRSNPSIIVENSHTQLNCGCWLEVKLWSSVRERKSHTTRIRKLGNIYTRYTTPQPHKNKAPPFTREPNCFVGRLLLSDLIRSRLLSA